MSRTVLWSIDTWSVTWSRSLWQVDKLIVFPALPSSLLHCQPPCALLVTPVARPNGRHDIPLSISPHQCSVLQAWCQLWPFDWLSLSLRNIVIHEVSNPLVSLVHLPIMHMLTLKPWPLTFNLLTIQFSDKHARTASLATSHRPHVHCKLDYCNAMSEE